MMDSRTRRDRAASIAPDKAAALKALHAHEGWSVLEDEVADMDIKDGLRTLRNGAPPRDTGPMTALLIFLQGRASGRAEIMDFVRCVAGSTQEVSPCE